MTVALCVSLVPVGVLAETDGEMAGQKMGAVILEASLPDEETPEGSEDVGLVDVLAEAEEAGNPDPADASETEEVEFQVMPEEENDPEAETEEEAEGIQTLAVIEEEAPETEAEEIQTLAAIGEDAEGEEENGEIATLAYEGDGSGRVVLNLGNGNGTYNFADYTGNRNAGTLLRYTTDALNAYADEDGNLTIHLPTDEDLNKTFTVVDAVGTEGDDDYLPAVIVDLGSDAAYDYTLIGWVNIATGEYYEAGAAAEINLDNENVFYADWIAASYDHGSSSDAGLADTVSTKGFVTIHLYDFNEIFNMYSASVEQNVSDDKSTIDETWSDSGTMYDTLLGANLKNGSELTNSFIFVNDGATQATGQLGYVAGQTAGNKWTGSGNLPRDAYEQWGITSPSSAPLPMLFDPGESYHGVYYVGEGDYLFQIDEDGYYFFNSDQTTATYNQSDGRFYVYDGTQTVTNVNFPCFLPFNDYEAGLNALDGSVDYWFGMDMTVDFYLANAVGRGGNLLDGEHMVFNFSGDDDILIFVDGEMLLDMSGIHDESFGSIDFTDGTVTMGMSVDSDGNITDGTTEEFSLGAGNHTLQVYYMERGGRASNLEIQFNVMPAWEYESGAVQTVTAEKIWQNAEGIVITDAADMPAVEVGLFDVVSEQTDENLNGYTRDGNTYTLEYTDDKNVYHKYEYTIRYSGDSLVYTEGDRTVAYRNTNAEGKVLDDDGLVIAWFEDGKLYVRIDEQTLSSENDWYYAWELLDADGEYEARELSESSSYTTATTSEALTAHQYWHVIGEQEMQSHVSDSDYPVILTEAAQEEAGVIGDTKEAYGWVIVGTAGGVETQKVKFSQIATMEKITNAEDDTWTYYGVYGVTSQSEIEALGSGAVWYMEDAKKQASDVDGESLEEFRLYCMLDGTKQYLALNQDTDTLMMSEEFGASFYYDALGELMVEIADDAGNTETVRVEILEDGTINIDEAEEAAAVDDIRIYTLSETESNGFAFSAVNTLRSEKLSFSEEEIISGDITVSDSSKEEMISEGAPKTDDPGQVALWAVLLAVGGLATVGVMAAQTKRMRQRRR